MWGAVRPHDIPDEMILNWDQTGVNIVPVGSWTLKEEGSKQVPITGLEDKRRITCTLLLTTTCPGNSSHRRCYTRGFLRSGASMLRYVDQVLIPYMESQREQLGIDTDHPGRHLWRVQSSPEP
ncbi:Hypp4045 [Branchiostoma lanceolatum]|uniref:Hypp4045 protein n=1 Tax=Branchiostoma lanceolatum TaxID=7740 RepID=A0A8K0EWF0_BRALA|nr:Hypp4045 [Branchiostoma lanceolatum]